MAKFCFVIHPLSFEDVVRYEPGARGKGKPIIAKILEWMPSYAAAHVTGIRTPDGRETEGWFVAAPLLPEQMLAFPREQVYERAFRPPEKRHEPWLGRCRTQMHGALSELERHAAERGTGRWLVGERMTQADITAVCAFTFLTEALALSAHTAPYPALRALAARCEALPEFQSTRIEFFVPQS